MVLCIDFLIEINHIITGSNNITLNKVKINPYWFDKVYMDKELILDKLYQTIDPFSERKSTSTKIYSILLNSVHPFYDGNGRMCKIPFANDDIRRQNT